MYWLTLNQTLATCRSGTLEVMQPVKMTPQLQSTWVTEHSILFPLCKPTLVHLQQIILLEFHKK